MHKQKLSRYEVARVVGLRALQIAEGDPPLVHVEDETLRCDATYVAARELQARVLDMQVERPSGARVDVRTAGMPPELAALLDTRDGGMRYDDGGSDGK